MSKAVVFEHADHPDLTVHILLKTNLTGVKPSFSVPGEHLIYDDFSGTYLLNKDGNMLRMKISNSPFDTQLVVNGKRYDLDIQAAWYEILLGASPIILMLIGGLAGCLLGYTSLMINMNYLRFKKDKSKYIVTVLLNILPAIVILYICTLIYSSRYDLYELFF